MDFVKLTNDALDINEISGLVFAKSCGAVSIFAGVTRDNFENKAVFCLEYEAYEPMALKALKAICEKIREKWPNVHNIALYHRLGTVPVKESSVVIAISSPHRSDSLEAVQYAIEELKASVPIWKKEIYSGNNSNDGQWKENAECPWANKK